jgi:hypothetical protein
MARKPSDLVQVKVRMPERLRRLIEAEAKKNKRTQTQEMVERLEQSFTDVHDEETSERQVITKWVKAVAEEIGRQDIVQAIEAQLKKEEDSNG